MWGAAYASASFVQPILRFNTKAAADFVCYPLQTIGDKDVQFKDSSRWGHRRAFTASTVLPLLSVTADRRRNRIDKLPWVDALKGSRTQPGVKITFSLVTNLKQGTLDMCKSTAWMRARSVHQELGNIHFGWCAFLTHSWLVCAAVVADIRPAPTWLNWSQIGLRRSEFGQCWRLRPKSAADPGYPGTDFWEEFSHGYPAVCV